MDRDKILFFRNFFYAAFVIGLIFGVLLRRDDSILEYWSILGYTLLQNRRKRVRQTGFTVFHPTARGGCLFLSCAGLGLALDGAEKVNRRSATHHEQAFRSTRLLDRSHTLRKVE
jgi:hypothetical protein